MKVAPMPLTEVEIKGLGPVEKVTRRFDSAGLYLELSPSGGTWWRLK